MLWVSGQFTDCAEIQSYTVSGIVNDGIQNVRNRKYQVEVGGIKHIFPAGIHPHFHLFNPFTRKSVSKELLDDIVMELQKYKDTKFYTCHCTGKTAFDYLSHHMNNIYYISCGETVEI